VSATGLVHSLPRTSIRVSARPGAWRDYGLALVLIVAAGAAVHGQRVQANLHRHHWEDWRFFRHARTQVTTPLECFTRPGAWPGLYRPLSTNAYYLGGRWLFGNRVEPYHAVNALLFAANALLLFAIARWLLPGPWAFAPPTLFVSRLAQYQVLLHTSEIQALLSSFFALAAILLFLAGSRRGDRRCDAWCAAALAMGLLCKESVVMVPALLTAYALLSERPVPWRRLAVTWLVLLAWLGAFGLARRFVGGGAPTGFRYDFSWAIAERFVAYGLSFANVLVWPIDSAEMTVRIVSLSTRPWVLAVVSTLLVALSAAAVRGRGSGGSGAASRTIAFGLAWFLLGMAPFVGFANRLFMRYTYFGHAGLALALTGAAWLAADALPRRWLPDSD
jgi:hypothetical protein